MPSAINQFSQLMAHKSILIRSDGYLLKQVCCRHICVCLMIRLFEIGIEATENENYQLLFYFLYLWTIIIFFLNECISYLISLKIFIICLIIMPFILELSL